VFALSGCDSAYLGLKLVNDGACPITEVVMHPAVADGEDPSFEAQINRMPTDASGATIALLPNDETGLPWLVRKEVYEVLVTFYDRDTATFRQVRCPSPVDLTGEKRGSTLIITAAMDANKAATFNFEVNGDNPFFVTWF
jgi:hypothetical protein